MTILALHHVQLAIPEGREDDARSFYSGILGFVEIPKPPDLALRGGCWFVAGDVHIHLGVEHEFRAARKAHPALLVDDLRALLERCTGAGITVSAGKPLQGYVRGDIFDPFGNRIEILQRL